MIHQPTQPMSHLLEIPTMIHQPTQPMSHLLEMVAQAEQEGAMEEPNLQDPQDHQGGL